MFNKKLFLLVTLSLVALITLTLASCGGGGSSSSSDSPSSGDGTIRLSLTDSASQDYRAIYVTIDRVEVKRVDETWEIAATPLATYDLLELVNGVTVVLGEEKLPAGDYTQMRLIIGDTPDDTLNIDDKNHEYANYLIMADHSINELKIPSGPQTGIKLVSGFTINENQATELLLDFDAMRSVVKAGNSGKYLLKPTIKVLNVVDYSSIAGTVTTTSNQLASPLPGAFVSAQTGDPLNIQAGTVTDDEGGYKLFLMPDDYTLVATADGYLPACDSLPLLTGDDVVDFNFDLALAATTFSLSGTVTITNPSVDQSVNLTFYQELVCNDASTATAVVRELNVAEGGSYDISLPAGGYDIVATTKDADGTETTIELGIDDLDSDRVENFNF